jgi:hypothetical protein
MMVMPFARASLSMIAEYRADTPAGGTQLDFFVAGSYSWWVAASLSHFLPRPPR